MLFSESDRVELKQIINSDFKKEIISFANTDGGDIYVGVADDGTVVGIPNIDLAMERISSMIHDAIHPDLLPFTSLEKLKIDDKEIIHLNISKGGRPPYYIREKGLKPSGVYIRHGVASIPASEEMIRQMIRESDGLTYDKARSMNQSLTFDYASQYFAKRGVEFGPKQMRTLGLIDADGMYTNTALLLSDQCEHTLKFAIFQGEDKLLFKSRKEFTGSLLQQLEEGYEYLSYFNNVNSDFVRLQRVDSYDYPEYALREALLNALIHRDYNYSASTIVNVYTNRIEFVSLGAMVKGLFLEDITHGASQSRNTLLANVFYRLQLIESYGTGIMRILKSYEGFATPQFLALPSSFVTVLPNLHVENKQRDMMVRETRAEYRARTMDEMTNEEKVMYLIMHQKYVTRREVEKVLGTSSFPARQLLNAMLKEGKIVAVGNARATKYALKE